MPNHLKNFLQLNKKCIFVIIFMCILFGLFTFTVSIFAIKKSVINKCKESQSIYSGDCVESLIQWLDDDSNSYRSKNNAIWALGQIGNAKALPTLEKYYTGNIPEKEPIDGGISQYELKKALNLLNGEFNAARFIYGNIE